MASITRSITELVPSLGIGIRLGDDAIFSLKSNSLFPKTIVGILQSWEVASAFQHLDLLVKTGQLSPHIAKVVEPLLRYSRLCYTGVCLGLVLDISSSTSVIDIKMRKVMRGIFQGIGVASHIVSLTCAVFLIACGKRALGIASASILLIGLIDRCALLPPKASFRFKNSLQFIRIGANMITGSYTEKFYSAAMLVSRGRKFYSPVKKLAKVKEETISLPKWDETHQLSGYHVDEFFKQGGIPTHCFSANFTHLNYALPSRTGRDPSLQEKILFELQDCRIECANEFLAQHRAIFPSLSLEDFCEFGLQKEAANLFNESLVSHESLQLPLTLSENFMEEKMEITNERTAIESLPKEKQQGISAFETYFRTMYKAEELINRISNSVSEGRFQEEYLNSYMTFWTSSLKLENGRSDELVANFKLLTNREKIKLILFDMDIIKDRNAVF